MPDVFISYKSERRSAARHLAKTLRLYGFETWYDYGLLPGEDFEERLLRELDNSRICVVIWCSLSIHSIWVEKEASIAFKDNKLIPIKIETCQIPEKYCRLDTIDISNWDASPRSHVIDRLIAEIGRKLGRNPKPDFAGLREFDEDWRSLGAPTLAKFALIEAIPHMREETTRTLDKPNLISERDLIGTHWRIYPPNPKNRREIWFMAGGKAFLKHNGIFEKKWEYTWSVDGGIVECYNESSRYTFEYDNGRLFGAASIDNPPQYFEVFGEKL